MNDLTIGATYEGGNEKFNVNNDNANKGKCQKGATDRASQPLLHPTQIGIQPGFGVVHGPARLVVDAVHAPVRQNDAHFEGTFAVKGFLKKRGK